MTKPTTKPITIPRDLKRGDIIVDKDGHKHICQPVAMDGSCYDNGRVWTAADHIATYGQWFARDFNDTFGELAYGIIRKTSKTDRVGRKIKSEVWWGRFNLNFLCGVSYRRKDAWNEIRGLADWPNERSMRKAFSVRKVTITWGDAIARRLNGDGKP